jgi:hypothetical protein
MRICAAFSSHRNVMFADAHKCEKILISDLNYIHISLKKLNYLGIWNCPDPSFEDFIRAPTDFSNRTRTLAYFYCLPLRFTSNTARTRKCHFIQLSRNCLNVSFKSNVWPFPPSSWTYPLTTWWTEFYPSWKMSEHSKILHRGVVNIVKQACAIIFAK